MTGLFDCLSSKIKSRIYTAAGGSSTYSLDCTGGKIARSTSTTGRTYSAHNSDEESSIRAFWKNSYTFTGTAKTGYHLVKINANGTTYTSTATYTFSSVTEDKYFYAYFTANSYSVLFDGNGATSGSTDDMESLYYDTTYTLNENAFVRSGYTFTGWNTKADGSGTSYTDEESFSNLTSTDGGTITLYAQWEENRVTINITKVSSETSTDEDGNTVYTYLEGVKFSLYELICEGSSHDHDSDEDLIDTGDYDTTCWELIGTYTSGEDGIFTLSDLPITGIYRLVETKTIEDYVLPSGQWKIEFEYDDNLTGTTYTVNGVELKVTGINNPPAISLIDDTLYLYNNTSYDLPTTGAIGINSFIQIGAIIISIGIILKLLKKRKEVTQTKFGSLRESVNNARKITDNWDKRK